MSCPKAVMALLAFAAGVTALHGQFAQTNLFTNVSLPIPDGDVNGVQDVRNVVSDIVQITSVRVRLNVAGQFNGDLYGYVRHSSGTTTKISVLLNRPGRTASNIYGYADRGFDVTFDDSAATDIHIYRSVTNPPTGSPLYGTWQPDARFVDPATVTTDSSRTVFLSGFAGLSAGGNWTLFLADVDAGATNFLSSWGLEITGRKTPTITWANPAPIAFGTALGASQLNATADVGGTFAYDPPAGTILATGNHTLSVTFVPADANSYVVTTASVPLTVTGVVAGRRVFYNHSAWDGNDAAANANDDNAVAPDKAVLLPGGTATFTNYTSYSRGLNGIMVDIAGLAGTPTVSDFGFKFGNDNTPAGWSIAPAPVSVTVRVGAGAGGSARVTLIWNDNNLDGVVDANEAVAKQWLEVTVKATANTGLAADDVFYFGNAPGEAGDTTANAIVNPADELLARANPRNFLNPAPLDFPYDYNRDQRVDPADQLIARANQNNFLSALKLITLSSASPAPKSLIRAAVETPQTLTIQQEGTVVWIVFRGPAQITPLLTTRMDLVQGPWTSVSTLPTYNPDDSSWTWQLDPSGQTTQAFYRLVNPKGN